MSSQLTFIETGWHNHVRPFQYIQELLNSYGTPAASAAMVAAPLFMDVTQTYERLTNQYFGDNTYTYFRAQDLGGRYRWTAKFAPFDSVFFKLCTKLPDYTSINDNLAAALSFLRSWQQSAGAYSLVEHFEGLHGTRANQVNQSVNAEGIVESDISFISRFITKPNTVNPFTTPTMVNFASISTTPWTNIDNGSLPLSVNSVTYPTDSYSISIANALNDKAYNGSKILDTNKLMKQHITGSFMGVVGKDLNLEGFFDNVSLSNIPLSYAVKPATFTWTLTDVNLKTMEKAQSASSEDEWRLNISFDARVQSITP